MITYAKAVFPDKWRCIGIPLETHTLGHALLMHRLDNPLSGRPPAGPRVVQRGELLQALMICTRSWRSARALVDTHLENMWMAWRSIRLQKCGMESALMEIHAYLLSAWPEIDWWRPADGRSINRGAELLQVLIAQQQSAGLTLEAALDVPVAVAFWDLAAQSEKDGVINICGQSDSRILEHYDQLVASGRLPAPGTKVDRKRN